MKNLDKDYARRKLGVLLRDLDNYNAGEFWREMSRIASGATGADHAEQLQQKNAELEAQVHDSRLPANNKGGSGCSINSIKGLVSINYACPDCGSLSLYMSPVKNNIGAESKGVDFVNMGIQHELLLCSCGAINNWDSLKAQNVNAEGCRQANNIEEFRQVEDGD